MTTGEESNNSGSGGGGGGSSNNVLEQEQLGSLMKMYLKQNKMEQLSDALTSVSRQRAQEIERLCQQNYQPFAHSVNELLAVRESVRILADKVRHLAQEYSDAGERTLEEKRALVAYQRVILNMDMCVRTARQCLHLLESMAHLAYQVQQRNYYGALNTIQHLEIDLAASSTAHYEFVRYILDSIPIMRANIRQAVWDGMKDWLVAIRDTSRLVGQVAMDHTSHHSPNNHAHTTTTTTIKHTNPIHSSRSSLSLHSIGVILAEEDELDPVNNDRVCVDFKPLYQCLHIHSCLGALESFKQQYEENRRLQANLILSTPVSLNQGDVSIAAFEDFLNEVVGFFIVEHSVVHNTDDFRSRLSVDVLWESTTAKLHSLVLHSLKDCEDASHFLRVKELLGLVIGTMARYGYSTGGLVEVLMMFFERYLDLNMHDAVARIQLAIDEDEGNGITIHTEHELRDILAVYKFKQARDAMDKLKANHKAGQQNEQLASELGLPLTLSFSKSMLTCCKEVKQLIATFHLFASGLSQSTTAPMSSSTTHALSPRSTLVETDALLHKSIQRLLGDHVAVLIEQKVCRDPIQLSEVMRMVVNLEEMERFVTSEVAKWVARERTHYKRSGDNAGLSQKRTGGASGEADLDASWRAGSNSVKQETSSTVPLVSTCVQKFRKVSKRAEERLFELVHVKMGSFMELHDYDFGADLHSTHNMTAVHRPGSPNKKDLSQHIGQPSQYLLDLVTFLDTVCQSTLAELPVSIKSFIYYEAIYYISTSTMSLLTSPAVKKLAPAFIDGQFKLDMDFLLAYIRNLNDEKLMDPVEDLVEVMRLLKASGDFEAYLDKEKRRRQFGRIQPRVALVLLEKYREGGRWDAVTDSSSLGGGSGGGTTGGSGGGSGQSGSGMSGFSALFGAGGHSKERDRQAVEQELRNKWKMARKKALDATIRGLKDELKMK